MQAWALNRDKLVQVLPHAIPRMDTLSDFSPLTAFLTSGMLPVDVEKYTSLKTSEEELKEILQFALWDMEALKEWERDAIFSTLKTLADSMQIKLKDFLAPLFLAISGTTSSFSVMDAMVILGPDMSRARLRHSLNGIFGEIGKKQLKKLEKKYESIKRVSVTDSSAANH